MGESSNSLSIKLLLVGDSDVGKTCSILTLQGGDEYDLNAVECYDLSITMKSPSTGKSGKLVICVQDTAGDPSFDKIRQCYYTSSNNLVVMFFSLISKPSLESIKTKWLPEYKKYGNGNCPVVLVGTYVDKKLEAENTTISTEQGSLMAAEIGAIKYFEICATDPVSTKTFYIEAARIALSYAKSKPPEQSNPKRQSPAPKQSISRVPLPDIPVQPQSRHQKSPTRRQISPSHAPSNSMPAPPLTKQQIKHQQKSKSQREQQQQQQQRNRLRFNEMTSPETDDSKSPKFGSEPSLPCVTSPSPSPSPSPPPAPSGDGTAEKDPASTGSQLPPLGKSTWSCGKPDKSKQKFGKGKVTFFTAKKPDDFRPTVKERRSQSHNFGGSEKEDPKTSSGDFEEEEARSMSSPMSPQIKTASRSDENPRDTDVRPLLFDENGKKVGRRTKRRERMEEISAMTKANPACLDIQQMLMEQSQMGSQLDSNVSPPSPTANTQSQADPALPQVKAQSQDAPLSPRAKTGSQEAILSPRTKTGSQEALLSPRGKDAPLSPRSAQIQDNQLSPQTTQIQEPQMNYQMSTIYKGTESAKKMRPPTSILYPGELQQNVGSSLLGVSHGAKAKAVHFDVWIYRNVPISPLIADLWEQSQEMCVLKLRAQAQKCVFSFCTEHGRSLWSVAVNQDALLAVEDSTRFFVLNVSPPIGLGFSTREESNAFVIEFMKKVYESKNVNNGRKKIFPFLKSTFKKGDSKSSASTSTSSGSPSDLSTPPTPQASSSSSTTSFVPENDPVVHVESETKEYEVFYKLEDQFNSANSENNLSGSMSSLPPPSSASSLASPGTPLSTSAKTKYRQYHINISQEGYGIDLFVTDESGLEMGIRADPGVTIGDEDRKKAIVAVKEFSAEMDAVVERAKAKVPEIKASYSANVEAEAAKDRMYSKLTVERVRSRLNLEIKK